MLEKSKELRERLLKLEKEAREELIDEIKEIISKEFYGLEEIEKEFETNQEIIRTRNKILTKLNSIK